jgi:HAD superfamily phosphoserine phosphatase-like hydrolase
VKNRQRSVALFDFDKTIYNEHSFFSLTKYFLDMGLLSKEVGEKVNAEVGLYKQKIQNYSETANKLLRIFGDGLRGKKYIEVLSLTEKFFEMNKANIYPYFEQILPKLRETHDVMLITVNVQMVAEVVVKRFGLDGYLSTQFEVVDGLFTGKILSTLADGKKVVEKLVESYSGETMAFGDSENDIEMLERVKHAICINPSEELRETALKRGWLVVSDQTAEKAILRLLKQD